MTISLAAKVPGRVLGNFIPHWAAVDAAPRAGNKMETSGACNCAVWEQLELAARATMESEPTLQGRHRDMQDSTFKYYSFVEFLLYVRQLFQTVQVYLVVVPEQVEWISDDSVAGRIGHIHRRPLTSCPLSWRLLEITLGNIEVTLGNIAVTLRQH